MNPETIRRKFDKMFQENEGMVFKPTRPDELYNWGKVTEESRKKDFYDYMKEKFNLTEDEFIAILKEKHPESLI